MGDDGRQTWCVDWRSAEEGDEMAPTLRGGGRDVPIVAAREESVTTDPAEPTAGATTKAGRSLAALESVIERGRETFVEVGRALAEIRDHELCKERGFRMWDDYLRERWGMSRSYASRQIAAAQVMGKLPIGNGPSNEAQARELLPLLEDEAAMAAYWRELQGHGVTVTAALIRETVKKILAYRPKGPRPHRRYRGPEAGRWIVGKAEAVRNVLTYLRITRLWMSRGADEPEIDATLAAAERELEAVADAIEKETHTPDERQKSA